MKTLSLILIFGIAATAFGQQRMTGTNEISLDQAIKIALDSNYTTRTAVNNLTVAQYSTTKANDNLLPTATATGSYAYAHSLTTINNPVTGLPEDPNTHTLSYNVGAAVNIYNGGFDASSIRSAEYGLDAAKYNLKWIRQQVAFNVVSAYTNALRTKELVATNEKTLTEYQAQLDRIKGLYAAGSVPIIQVYQQQSVVSQQEVQTIQARNNYLNAKADMLFLLNIAPDSYNNYDVSLRGIDTSVSGLKNKANESKASTEAINALIDQREDFLSQKANIQSSEEAIGITRSALLPRLGATVGIRGSGADPNIGKISLAHALNAGLNFSIPIYDAAQTRIQIDIQQVELETSKVQLNQAQEQFRSDIAKGENNVLSAEQAVAATVTELQSAEESLRAAVERLKVGAGIQVDVIIAEAQVQTARTDRVNAVYNYVLATRQLEYLLGKTNY
jgi:outer membrane protein